MLKTTAIYAVTLLALNASAQENLEYYVEQGFKNSPLLKGFENQMMALTLDSLIFRKSLLPQVSANSNLYYAPIVNGYGYDEALSNIHTLEALISVTQQLYGGKYAQNQYRSFRLSKDSLLAAGKVTQLDLRKTITAQYITSYGDLEQLKANREILDILYDGEVLLKRLTEHAVYKETDYVTYIVTVKQQELQAQQSLIQYQIDFGTLNYLSGLLTHRTLSSQSLRLHRTEGLSCGTTGSSDNSRLTA